MKCLYKKSALALVVLMSLTACKGSSNSSDSKDDTFPKPEPTVKNVTLKLITDNVRSFPELVPLTENRYQHVYELDGYKLKVNGEIVKTDISLDLDTPVEFTLTVPNEDAVLVEMIHPNLLEDLNGTVTFISTFDGETEIAKNQAHADIVVDNNHYSFVTLDLSDDIYVNAAMLNNELLKRSDENEYQDFVYKYGYTTEKDSTLIVETDLGLKAASFQTGSAKQFKFVIDEENGLDLDDDEDSIDQGGVIAVNPNNIKNANDVRVLEDASVTGYTLGTSNAVTSVIYPMVDLTGSVRSELPISRYDLDLDLDIDDDTVSGYTNIYLLNTEGTKCRADFFLTGNSKGQVNVGFGSGNCGDYSKSFSSYADFVEEHGRWTVRANYRELGLSLQPINFVTRIGGSNYEGITEFTVEKYGIKAQEQAIDIRKVLRAEDVKVAEDGSVVGTTTGKAPWAYHSIDEEKLLRDYTFNFDIEFDGADHFVNIYLQKDKNNVTASLYLSGTYEGQIDIDHNYMEFSEFMNEYGDYTVRNYNSFPHFGNFFWRGGDSRYTGEGDQFTIHNFTVK